MKKKSSLENYLFSTDKRLLQTEVIHGYLSRSYWAENIPMETVKRSIEHSLCFGIYLEGVQVGFARVISDFSTFGYLADVFVLEEHRGIGLSKKLMEFILAQPSLQGLRNFALMTKDAQGLYTQFGFRHLEDPSRFMARKVENIYRMGNPLT